MPTKIDGQQIQDETITAEEIKDGTVYRRDLNITSSGNALITKIITSSGITMSYTGADPGTGDVTLSIATSAGLTESSHRSLDQLVHEVSENFYYEVTRTGGKITKETWWTNVSKTTKIREIDYTYSGSSITTQVTKQYDSSGNVKVGETLSETYNYVGSLINSITATLS